MTKTYAILIMLALGAPLAAAEQRAPELPFMDTASVRAQMTDGGIKDLGTSITVEKVSAKKDISGTYLIKSGQAKGSVTVRQFSMNNSENAAFILSTVAGPSAHTADISGVAVQTQKGDFAFRDESGCALRLKVSNGVLTVTGANATCGGNMGMNAAADGNYTKSAGYIPGRLDGSYAVNNGYMKGNLEVREFLPGPDSSLPSLGFAISTVSGPSAHTADISGIAVRTTTPGEFAFVGEDGCELRLKPVKGAMLVSKGNGSCGSYMGANAAVDGKYSKKY